MSKKVCTFRIFTFNVFRNDVHLCISKYLVFRTSDHHDIYTVLSRNVQNHFLLVSEASGTNWRNHESMKYFPWKLKNLFKMRGNISNRILNFFPILVMEKLKKYIWSKTHTPLKPHQKIKIWKISSQKFLEP